MTRTNAASILDDVYQLVGYQEGENYSGIDGQKAEAIVRRAEVAASIAPSSKTKVESEV